jgi:hypothetical protein
MKNKPAKIYIHEEYQGKLVVSITEYYSDGTFMLTKIDSSGLKLYKYFKIEDGNIIRTS